MNRQERVQRLKRIIILTLIIAILIPTVLCIYLMIRVHSLEREMKNLYQTRIEYLQVEAKQAASSTSQSANEVLSIADSEPLEVAETSAFEDEKAAAISSDSVSADCVYLTFDDGPSIYTGDILDILKRYNVKATFFVVGKTDSNLVPLYKRIVDEGHTIGMHSYSHKYKDIYQSVTSFEEDLDRIRELVYNETGVWSEYYRFPGGSSNNVSRLPMSEYVKCLDEYGIRYFDWNVASGDAVSTSLSKEEILQNVMDSYGKYHTSVVLMHDTGNRETTVEALPEMIEAYQKQGVRLLAIDESTPLVQHVQIQE